MQVAHSSKVMSRVNGLLAPCPGGSIATVVNRGRKCSTWASQSVLPIRRLGHITIAGPEPTTPTLSVPRVVSTSWFTVVTCQA